MLGILSITSLPPAALDPIGFLQAVKPYVLIFVGFSLVIFVHELGHFAVAKWAKVRVDRFAVGFGREVFGFTYGETRYSFNILPMGGYVKMLGQEDFVVDKSGELKVKESPNSFTYKPVGHRMAIVSAGVVANIFFAAFLFMIVFLVGMEAVAPEVGFIIPDSPAARAGIQPGDRIVSINDRDIADFSELTTAVVLCDPGEPLDFIVERNDEFKTFRITPEVDSAQSKLKIGVGMAWTNEIVALSQAVDQTKDDVPRVGDRIVEINGQAISEDEAVFVIVRVRESHGEPVNLVVERPVGDSETYERVPVQLHPEFTLLPSTVNDDGTRNVLGLVPRVKVTKVEASSRAYYAGLAEGDVIVQWGPHRNPKARQIIESVKANGENDIVVVVRRQITGSTETLLVRPKVDYNWFQPGAPYIGVEFGGVDEDRLLVADVIAEIDGRPTPAKQAGIPVGVTITRVADQPVSTWPEMTEIFRAHAGQSVDVAYLDESGAETTAKLNVPNSITTLLDLGPLCAITSIDGKTAVRVEVDGKSKSVSVYGWLGQQEALKQCVGRTVVVKYMDQSNLTKHEAQLTVTADMIDPWLFRVHYNVPFLITVPKMTLLKTSNPVKAMWIGVKKTVYLCVQVYATMKRMFVDKSVGMENVAGPVGIVNMGSKLAAAGIIPLIYFLAFISANLAVINFLPLPIVDGGMMVFLLIEKIKGSPVSLKMQMATQLVGLALIILAFLFVTFQDIARLAG